MAARGLAGIVTGASCAAVPGTATPGNLRSAFRFWITSGNRYDYNGFRVARTLSP